MARRKAEPDAPKQHGPKQHFVPSTVATSGAKRPPSIWERDGETLKLKLHPGQLRTWESDKRFVLMLAGTQGGKTTFGPWWMYREILRHGSADYIAVTASFDMFRLKMLPSMRECFEHVLRIGRFWSGPGIIELSDPTTGKFWADRSDSPMWGRIILRSAMSPGGLESTTAAAAWLDEAGQPSFSMQTWEAVLRRLSLYMGRALITTTLYEAGGWLKTLSDRAQAGDKTIDVVQFASTANPAFSNEEFERAKGSMQEHRFRMFYLGEFARTPGTIYDLPNDQIIPRFPIPAHWPVIVGIDFGAVNTAVVWVAHDQENDRYIVFQERLEGGKTTEEHCREVLAMSRFYDPLAERTRDYHIIAWYGGAPGETQQRMDWQANEVPVYQPLVADLEGGIDRVASLLKKQQLFFFSDCDGTIKNVREYKRQMNDQGEVFEQIKDKQTFHYGDALRYLCTGLVGAEIVTAPSIW